MNNIYSSPNIAVIGLGYVGLPLAVAFAAKANVVGYDISSTRIEELSSGHDRTLEVSEAELLAAPHLSFTSDVADLTACNVYIVTTPTPIDASKRPDLSALLGASRDLATTLQPGDTVIYESTVYPGVTEDECVPVLEAVSGLTFNVDFTVGYSPERINPGDKQHRVENIVKVTSGSTPEAAEFIDNLYRTVIKAGTHMAPSIKVAEAAKVIENTQRDVNIALVNELAVLFDKMNIDTHEVLEAAGTKWNFLPFKPGLVGGHCIGVDPYYLTHKAQSIGHNPEIILAGRRLNDSMGQYVAKRLIKAMLKSQPRFGTGRVLVLGLTFKENTPDSRNTRVVDVIEELRSYGLTVDVSDPWADARVVSEEYGIELMESIPLGVYDAIIVAVAHDEFRNMGTDTIRTHGRSDALVFDLKRVLPDGEADLRL